MESEATREMVRAAQTAARKALVRAAMAYAATCLLAVSEGINPDGNKRMAETAFGIAHAFKNNLLDS